MVRKAFQGRIFLRACFRFCPGTAYIVSEMTCPNPICVGVYGSEPQTGAFSVRRQARGLMRAWYAREFYRHEERYRNYSSSDQQALLAVLRHHQYSFFPLPGAFNYRPQTMPTVGAASKAGFAEQFAIAHAGRGRIPHLSFVGLARRTRHACDQRR
jgi:hypothetical protein